ncbi:MAG TPA: isochorismatase [Cyanobacteria bacterium UBA11149]|nr:isochorismatase [Cyanobacteria bacterium UBA11367]HBE58568.1 isochorismatase [Cyanobacteria bacterium UBA11366]HBK65247.1 isochorismatase [Cyanobacteria bacterium UBA11166]HBR76496.1 isochorismatase [Cyanobacteria bacterium UBA11159]HBS67866.1 isochorismatase [Cyanobacteria bacterium UBA11153]HBW90095.1 isochorismatase [Cyanobacteria bacterium UBA11149]HCA93717.1 isochorismatase [Cyanobacteria bacterium UBA9226]
MTSKTILQLPIPDFFNPQKIGEVWRVPYQTRAAQAKAWAKEHNIQSSRSDEEAGTRICLLLIDVQNTFCIPGFELFVGGKSGLAAVEDNVRLCEFIYRNLHVITEIIPTMDTHRAIQIFHPIFWVNSAGEHPTPGTTIISLADVEQGVWQVNPEVARSLGEGKELALQEYAYHYVKKLSDAGKFPLIIWPYHSMLGGIGHALVSAVEEAIFFHSIARKTQTKFELKGDNPLTENYSVLRPEVLEDNLGKPIAYKNTQLIEKLLNCDRIIIAGQAKSHCVAWTIDDLLTAMVTIDANLAKKVYVLEDCTSPVVISEEIDFTAQADAAFQRFADAGMNVVKSTTPLTSLAN